MILRKLLLNNFGLYSGLCEFDLAPVKTRGKTRPIVLIGGKNGSGKTTFLEGVRLALYGRRALGARVSQSEYDDYLRRHLHKDATTNAVSVGIEFDYAEAGQVHHYRVSREWAIRDKSVVESLVLEKDGLPVTSVPREEYHQFLQELIPPGVSQLFFFDGEKIAEIADGSDDNEQLAHAIKSLLGIDLVGRLRTDLGLYLARHQQSEDSGTGTGLEAVMRDLGVLEKRYSDLIAEIAEITMQRDSQARVAEQVRRRFVAEGGDAAVQRARIEAEIQDVKQHIKRSEHELRELANGLLPFAFSPTAVVGLRKALTGTIAGTSPSKSNIESAEAINKWRHDEVPKRKAKWTNTHWDDLQAFIQASADHDKPVTSMVPYMPEIGDGAAALARLVEVDLIARPRALGLCQELDNGTARLSSLEIALSRANNAATGFLLDELRMAEQKLGATESGLAAKQEELKGVSYQRTVLERERRKLLEEQTESANNVQRAELASRAAKALTAYEERLITHKLAQLRGEFVRRFNYIARKNDLVADISIDPETFVTTLIDKKGRAITKSMLSAGEQQVYAVAMLWALARTSGRPLPMIIDTPLARLDSEHRDNLVTRYFPNASHQVVLLSTDTELDDNLLSKLEQSISHAFQLVYDRSTGKAVIQPGYFEGSRWGKERSHALQQA